MIFSLLKIKVKVKKMQIRKIKYKNGREIYRKRSLLDKIKYYEDLIYGVVFGLGLIAVIVFVFVGFIKF